MQTDDRLVGQLLAISFECFTVGWATGKASGG